MTVRTQTDNRSLRDKVRLRSDICARLGEPLRILDLFAGEGWIWKKMGETFPIAAYTPVDIRPRQPGCIRLDVNGRTVHAFNPNQFNVIDIDTCGDGHVGMASPGPFGTGWRRASSAGWRSSLPAGSKAGVRLHSRTFCAASRGSPRTGVRPRTTSYCASSAAGISFPHSSISRSSRHCISSTGVDYYGLLLSPKA